MNIKKCILIFFIFLLCIVNAFGMRLSTYQDLDYNLMIQSPQIYNYIQGKDHIYNFRVYNMTDGLLYLNDSVSCNLYITNQTGDEIYTSGDSKLMDGTAFTFNVASTNFSIVGEYAYLIQCNTSDSRAFYSAPIYVTKDGIDMDSNNMNVNTPFVSMVSILMILFYATVLLYIFSKVSSPAIRLFTLITAFLEILLGFAIVYNTSLGNSNSEMNKINFYMQLVLTFVMFFLFYWITFKKNVQDTEKRRESWEDMD